MKSRIAIVLVEPENADNIGAVARAMKNMGISDLRLVNPPVNWKERGKVLAMSAQDTLGKAKLYTGLKEAVGDCHLVVGTTRRSGVRRSEFWDFDEAIENLAALGKSKKTAILFGKESKGLSNADLALCDKKIMIPSHNGYPSLNLAQAVMVICFSLFKNRGSKNGTEKLETVSKKEMLAALSRIEKALTVLGYDEGNNDVRGRIMATFQGLALRSGLLPKEAQMFHGLARRIIDKLGKSA